MNARRRAIAETNAFLTWAMQNPGDLPRIPRRRVDRGGFSELLKRPHASAVITHWWAKAIDRIREH